MNIEIAIEKLKEKDEQAFEYIYNCTKRLVYTVIINIAKDQSTTEDLMQDTYIKMIQNINSYNNKYKFTTWIATIARNTALDYYRKSKKQYSIDVHENEYLFPTTTNTGEDEYNTNYLMRNLTEDQREVVTLYALDELKHREIAEILNKPVGTVTWLYKSAMDKLRKELENER